MKPDTAVAQDCERTAREALDAFGQIDVLVNNAGLAQQHAAGPNSSAGIAGSTSPSRRPTDNRGRSSRTCSSPGAILNVSSIAGNRIGTSAPWYDATKAGIVGLSGHLTVEHGRARIRVNAPRLGLIETRRTAFIRDDAAAPQWLEA